MSFIQRHFKIKNGIVIKKIKNLINNRVLGPRSASRGVPSEIKILPFKKKYVNCRRSLKISSRGPEVIPRGYP